MRAFVCVRVCVCGRNALEVRTTLVYPHIKFIPHTVASATHKHTYILKPYEVSEPTGLKVDIAATARHGEGGGWWGGGGFTP